MRLVKGGKAKDRAKAKGGGGNRKSFWRTPSTRWVVERSASGVGWSAIQGCVGRGLGCEHGGQHGEGDGKGLARQKGGTQEGTWQDSSNDVTHLPLPPLSSAINPEQAPITPEAARSSPIPTHVSMVQ